MRKKIVGARETVELDPAGNLVRIAVYDFTLDDLGPFVYQVPKKEDTREGLITAIKAKEEIVGGPLD